MKLSKLNSSVRLLLRGVPVNEQNQRAVHRGSVSGRTREQDAVVDVESFESIPQVTSGSTLETLSLIDNQAVPALNVAEDVNVLLEGLVGGEDDV